jgi:hypothetical protein
MEFGGTGRGRELGNSDVVTGGIRNLRKRKAELAALIQVGDRMDPCLGARRHPADMANFMKDRSLLCQQQQQSEG